jgi:hypothetical protein
MLNMVTQQAAGLTSSDVTENILKLKHAKVKKTNWKEGPKSHP